MISSQKYRINSLAKDLGLKSKQLAGILPGGDAGITRICHRHADRIRT